MHPDADLTPSAGGTDTGALEPVHVLVATGNEVLRAGITTLIGRAPGFAVSGAPVGSATLVEVTQARQPDVLLVDLAMAKDLRDFLDVRSRGAIPDLAVVALTTDEVPDVDALRDLVLRGVNGIVTTNDHAPQLSGAMQAVRRGLRWLSPAIGSFLLEALARSVRTPPEPEPGATTLTSREHSVLKLVADGLTVSQIARRLHRSESAVKYHLANMSARYQASNRAHLVYLAIRAGDLRIDCRNGQCGNCSYGSGQADANTVS